ncbi:hypothetical protein [Actinomadura harenae]|uniref:Uncharacterized protein n=1 Tax=Actinomadura harenae TaxID=2483351 RepID=A0A3M2M5Q7_9ACTN|nr:hypothetical protein [Actinomadura harenae]RMI44926.1 hypothetical protein EBO15_11680 [Actinomadura harenae]
MYDPPGYLWAITIIGVTAFPLVTCVVLYGGAEHAGLSRSRAALLAGGAAVVIGGWFAASAVIADNGWYGRQPGVQMPWIPIAVVGFLSTLLALGRIPAVKHALEAPGMTSRLLLPHSFRVTGVVFLLVMGLGHLPALFALPAGLGDIAVGVAAPVVARKLAQGTGYRAARRFHAFGIADLVVAMVLGALTGYQLLNVPSSGAAISALPLVLIPTAAVPLLFALHITSLSQLATASRTPRPTTGSPLEPRAIVADGPSVP